jgi:hypothetical protein
VYIRVYEKVMRHIFSWWRNKPCYTEYWTNGGPVLVDCDSYWHVHEMELEEIKARNEEAERLSTRPEYV